jgi:hypothetical protein
MGSRQCQRAEVMTGGNTLREGLEAMPTRYSALSERATTAYANVLVKLCPRLPATSLLV